MTRLRKAASSRPVLALLIAAAVGAIIVVAITVPVLAGKSSEIDDLNSSLDEEGTARAAAEADRDAAEETADQIQSKKNLIIHTAREKAKKLVGDAEEKRSKIEGDIDDAQANLDSTQSKLDSLQASLSQAQEVKAQSSFGDGTFQSGVDYLPGTYTAPGGSGCYWEKLNGPSGGGINNIIDNGGFNKNQIVSVDSPYFSSDGCGTWTRTGD